MSFQTTPLLEVVIFEPRIFADNRGYFFESFNVNHWKQNGYDYNWVQDNEAKSSYGVLRGLHYQIGTMAQAKLVRVVKGSVLDVVLDVRKNSPTYGEWFGIVLSETNKKQLLVPRGFAHGYAVLEDETIFSYKCDNFYSMDDEAGVLYNDPQLNIDWNIPLESILLSDKDGILPVFGQHKDSEI